MTQHWPRWIFASISKHFDDRKQGLPLFIEGQNRNTRDTKDFFELRVDGPRLTELTKGSWHIYIEVNILVQSAMDDLDYHRIHRNVGIAVEAMTNLLIFKYGSKVEDDQSFLGCLKLIQDTRSRERIQVFNFGQIDVDTRLMQSAVEGHYEMNLEE